MSRQLPQVAAGQAMGDLLKTLSDDIRGLDKVKQVIRLEGPS